MAGFLPATRPITSSYGQSLQNEKPVRNPALEADATNYNDVRADVAFCGQLVPIAMIKVSNNGAVAKVRGYAIDLTYVTLTRTAAGKVTVDISASAHLNFLDSDATCNRAIGATACFASTENVTATQVKVHTEATAGDTDCDFMLKFY